MTPRAEFVVGGILGIIVGNFVLAFFGLFNIGLFVGLLVGLVCAWIEMPNATGTTSEGE